MIGDYEKMPAQQGWQCPICGRVYSPTTMMSLYCGNGKESISTTYLEVLQIIDKYKAESEDEE